jgi:hypothetical protein
MPDPAASGPAGTSEQGAVGHDDPVTTRRLTLVVLALLVAVTGLVVAVWNLTDTQERVPPIEVRTD